MYNSYFSRSKRAQAETEKEKSQSQYQWRTRVNTLMNTSDEPRHSKLTSHSHRDQRRPRDVADEKPRESTVVIQGNSSASKWLQDDRDIRQRYSWRDELLRRERFSRTKSEDQLKTGGVRFMSEDLPKTSKSLDGDDEADETTAFGKLRPRDKRHYSRDWTGPDEGGISPRGRGKDEGDAEDNDANAYGGACGGSFDSGLDLRISCSPDERADDDTAGHRGRASTRSRSHSSASNESIGSKSRDDSPVQTSSLSSTSSSRPIPCFATRDPLENGAIPKRPKEESIGGDLKDPEIKSKGIGKWNEFPNESHDIPDQRKQEDEFVCSRSFPRDGFSDKDYVTAKQQIKYKQQQAVVPPRLRNEAGNRPKNRNDLVNEIPGLSFFSNMGDDIEDIIQSVIDAEEKQIEDDTKELERMNDALMFSDEASGVAKSEKKSSDGIHECRDEFDYNLTKYSDCTESSDQPTFVRKRAASLPARVEEEEDDLTYLMFRSWKLKARKPQEEVRVEDEGVDDEWACVPSVLLEDVFTFLTPKERHQTSQVCRHWYDLFYSPRVWETFILLERTLTKKRFNLYKGYQRELCPWKAQMCLKRVGSFFKRIVITPISDYFNLCEFLRVLASFLEYQVGHGEMAMPLLHTFDFTFACATRSDEGLLVHGTGGQILDTIINLLTQMTNLKHLKVNQLLTDIDEVPGMFAALTRCFCECLSSLEMLNVTKVPYVITELAQFRNVIKLTVSPQHIDAEVIVLLAGINLVHLHLLQDVYTCACLPVPSEAWKLVKEMAPWLRVHLELSGTTRTPLLIQPRAPVHGIFFRTPYSRLSNDVVSGIVEHYSKTLRYLVQEHLPRTHCPRGFDKRCDSSLLFLIRRCQSLHTLVVAQRLSTATLILLATEGKTLSTLLVRQNALIKKCDWPSCGEWSREFYARLKENALDYDKCKDEVCRILKRRWRPLSDKQFMRLKIVPKVEMF